MKPDLKDYSPNKLRQRFLDFFDARMKEHAKAHGAGVKDDATLALPSSSLSPPDATTLFTSAGMHQFKDDFTGNLVHGTRAAATVQKCMRTPDLENVGKTPRHHTFFEMLGYFSFGDGLKGPNGSVGFFKKEAIKWIWDFYTLPWSEGGCGLPKEKLYVSVYGGDETGKDRDDEAAKLWKEILQPLYPDTELDNERIFYLDEHENFWPAGAPSQGPNGVCGPCSEIFYDLGEQWGEGNVESNDDRFMEIGNIVFTQFERSGPTPGKGTLTPLPQKNIDFGGGFERLVMVLEDVSATLDTSLFMPIRDRLVWELGWRFPHQKKTDSESVVRIKRIADHVRAAVFCIADGLSPGKDKADYIVRRIVRRAYRDGAALGADGPFLHKLVGAIVGHYGDAYPELKRNPEGLQSVLLAEESHFAETLEKGLQLLAGHVREMKKTGDKVMDGQPAFDLYQSHGLPVDVVLDELRADGLELDETGYEEAEEEHRKRSGGKKGELFDKGWYADVKANVKATEFVGYDNTEAPAKIVAMVREGQLVDELEHDSHAVIILDRSPFYAASGGQVGDTGVLLKGDSVFEVFDTTKRDDYWLHEGKLTNGKLHAGDEVRANVDAKRREKIKANHSATHLMHQALRDVLGDHVLQKGSEVNDKHLRFDFSHNKPVTFEQRQEIERIVNDQIRHNEEVCTDLMKPEEAQKAGALALFGEKYGNEVRVLSMGRGAGFQPARGEAGVPPAIEQFHPGEGPIDKHSRGDLPHWEREGATYFVTFRLADSLPEEARDAIEQERNNIILTAKQMDRELSDSEMERLKQLYTVETERWLNRGAGECHLQNDECAKVVKDALRHFDGDRYKVHAWVIMPNHVHVVFRAMPGHGLSEILHSWKSFTAKHCNKILARKGTFWMPESYDRLIRDAEEHRHWIDYTLSNPEKAGLSDWKWVGCSFEPAGGTPTSQQAGETPAPRAGGTPASRPFSRELCGGTHVNRTGDIGYFRITSEGSSSAGVRRIFAVTGEDAYQLAAEEAKQLALIQEVTKAQPGQAVEKVESLVKQVKDLKSKAKKGGGVDAGMVETLRKNAETVGDVTVYVGDVKNAEQPDLLTIKDALGQDGKPTAVLLGSRGDGRALLLLSFTKDLVGRGLHAGKIIGEIARLVGGGGGGKPEIAQAGGKNPDGLADALKTGTERIREALKQ